MPDNFNKDPMTDTSTVVRPSKLKHGNFVMLPKYISKYTERALPQHHWAARLIDKHDVDGASSIIDLGCRDGFAAMELARRYPKSHVIGYDNCIQLLESANENLAKQPIQNLEFSYMEDSSFHTSAPIRRDFFNSLFALDP